MHSNTRPPLYVTSQVTGKACPLTCLAGFDARGSHVCSADGAFHGAWCAAHACWAGAHLAHSTTRCSGASGDYCEYASGLAFATLMGGRGGECSLMSAQRAQTIYEEETTS